MTEKFLVDNGGYPDELYNDPTLDYKFEYKRHENKRIQEYVNNRRRFKKDDITEYLNSLPKDKTVTIKFPLLLYFLNEINIDREIKIVYVMRNPEQNIISSMEKSGKSFIYFFTKQNWVYDFIVSCKYTVLPFMAERIKKDGRLLLEYCELPTENIDYSSIRKFKTRKVTFLKYRFANFIWKRLSFLFKAFE